MDVARRFSFGPKIEVFHLDIPTTFFYKGEKIEQVLFRQNALIFKGTRVEIPRRDLISTQRHSYLTIKISRDGSFRILTLIFDPQQPDSIETLYSKLKKIREEKTEFEEFSLHPIKDSRWLDLIIIVLVGQSLLQNSKHIPTVQLILDRINKADAKPDGICEELIKCCEPWSSEMRNALKETLLDSFSQVLEMLNSYQTLLDELMEALKVKENISPTFWTNQVLIKPTSPFPKEEDDAEGTATIQYNGNSFIVDKFLVYAALRMDLVSEKLNGCRTALLADNPLTIKEQDDFFLLKYIFLFMQNQPFYLSNQEILTLYTFVKEANIGQFIDVLSEQGNKCERVRLLEKCEKTIDLPEDVGIKSTFDALGPDDPISAYIQAFKGQVVSLSPYLEQLEEVGKQLDTVYARRGSNPYQSFFYHPSSHKESALQRSADHSKV